MQLTICFPTSKSQRLLIGFIEVIIVYINGTLFGLSINEIWLCQLWHFNIDVCFHGSEQNKNVIITVVIKICLRNQHKWVNQSRKLTALVNRFKVMLIYTYLLKRINITSAFLDKGFQQRLHRCPIDLSFLFSELRVVTLNSGLP